MMNYSYKQVFIGDTINRNSVMVAPLLVDKETSFIDPNSRFQKITCKSKNKCIASKKHSDINKNKKTKLRVKDYKNKLYGYIPHDLYALSNVATFRNKT